MASAGVNMPGGDGSPAAANSAPPEWRVRRRGRRGPPRAAAAGSSGGGERRVRVRRAAASSSPSVGSLDQEQQQEEEEQAEEEAAGEVAGAAEEEEDEDDGGGELPPAGLQLAAAQPEAAAQVWPVAFGSLSIAGRMRTMEDTVSLRPAFCTWIDGSPMHFFAVFDGHGGSHVSMLCRDRMHALLAEELAEEGASFLDRRRQQHHEHQKHHHQQAASSSPPPATGGSAACSWSDEAEEEVAWRAALCRSFRRVDALAALACACGRVARPRCTCPLSGESPGIVGSTAVVALLVRGRLVVANCGDSRAVLCRGPAGAAPVPLSCDHKPDRPDELARIQAVGGRVLFNNGPRVRGILAMSRALGDRLLRPEVIPEPEITITDRTAEDECLILASDGMWDVIPNEIACNVARHCLQDGNPPPVQSAAAAPPPAAIPVAAGEAEPRCYRAASLLARLAIGRETPDNISIVVIDLKQRE
ncbi:hypothetical protein BS78_06G030300 [Paspalum vaginatum]|nr:hypothetical protein BS78_06G030300 [Paspalum vaginatum]KAJ1270118.1 hypothetical protein BS78_06G030300 [Paspalum vaginatum]KAJ1270119.1 hypothetical protein BS78_06G030300 [Paspalum vaginatum]